jgi:hypothetical protein
MIPCIIESPFRGANKAEEQRNRAYLEKCLRRAIRLGYTPYASHKMLTDALNDSLDRERELGMMAGIEMAVLLLKSSESTRVFFAIDYGESDGMKRSKEHYHTLGFGNRIVEMEIGKL